MNGRYLLLSIRDRLRIDRKEAFKKNSNENVLSAISKSIEDVNKLIIKL